jgi:rifampicin phosphotransferase
MTTTRSGSNDPGIGTLLPLKAATDPAIAGRKSAVLAELLTRGFPVPDGWVVPVDLATRIAVGESTPAANMLLSELPELPLAVRSSGVAEDGAERSFAGQYESMLGVQGIGAIRHAIAQVWHSGQAGRVRHYAGTLSTDDPLPTAILIQPMLAPQAAGVAFSANPVSGERDTVVINAVAGLGDRLLAGAVDGESWLVHDDRVTGPDGPAALSEDQARAVAALARSVEGVYGVPQDIEWAYEDGELYLLQARPITALPREPELPPLPPGTWMKETEHLLGISSVMFVSFYTPEIVRATSEVFGDVGAPVEGLRYIDRGGELYSQAIPPGDRHGTPPPGWVLGVLSRVVPAFRARMTAAKRAFERGLPDQWAREWHAWWKDELRSRAEALNAVDLSTLDDAALAEHALAIRELFRFGVLAHFRLSVPIIVSAYELVRISRELLGWDDTDAIMLIAASASASSEPTRALTDLVVLARTRPDVERALREPGVSLDRISSVDADFARRISDYLDRFGHRVIDNELASPTLYERPDLVLDLLREHLSSTSSPERRSADLQRQKRAEAERLLQSRPAADRQRFATALERAAEMNELREEKVLYTQYFPASLIRYAMLESGRRLARTGVLSRPDDVFSCEYDEVIAALRDAVPDGLRATALRRRAERAWTAAHPGPLLLGDPPTLPDVSWLPEPARTLASALTWFIRRETPPDTADGAGNALRGTPASAGRYEGTVRVIHEQSDFHRLKPGDVLVCPVTTSAWGVLFGTAGALVTDHGGVLSHPSIAAREHGIPAVVGTGDATSRLRDGQQVIVDGSTGRVEILQGAVEGG